MKINDRNKEQEIMLFTPVHPKRMLSSIILKFFLPLNKGVTRKVKKYLKENKCSFSPVDPEAYII